MSKIVILHHTDRDGIVSAAVISQALLKYEEYDYSEEDITFIAADYSRRLSEIIPDNFERLYMVDYSISNDINAKFIKDLSFEKNKRIIWLDHHISSLRMSDLYPELQNIPGYRLIGMAGCAICWMYVVWEYYAKRRESKDARKMHDYITSIIKKYNNDYNAIDHEKAVNILHNIRAPFVVEYSHRYDIWDLDENVELFSYGFNPKDPTDTELIEVLTEYSYSNIMVNAINRGHAIRRYVQNRNESIANQCGFELTVKVISRFAEKVYRAFAMNIVFANSQAFGKKMDQYDICIPFYFNGHNFTYSMYTNKLDTINCEKLCIAMGGGGHPAAAGFTADSLLVSPGGVLEIKLF